MSATTKMIEYARAIASKLRLDEPDFSSFNETSSFISEHSVIFKRMVNNERLANSLSTVYGEVEKHFSDDFLEMLNCLYEVKGLYIFWVDDEVVYIGKSINLQERIYSSLKERIRNAPITHVTSLATITEADMHIGEVLLITEYKPKLNVDCVCGDVSDRFKSGVDLYTKRKIKIFSESDDEQ